MIKLYGNPYSRANRVRWTLETIGLDYEEQQVALGKDGTGSESFRAINPNARIPVLDDDGLVLFESIPICLYLAKKYAADTLYVDAINDEGVVMQWSVWAMTELEANIETAAMHTTFFPAEKRNADLASGAQVEIGRCLTMLDKQLAATGYIVTERFTIADLIVSEVLTNVGYTGVDLNDFPAVKKYVTANLAQEAAKKAFSADILEPFLT